VRHLIRKNMQKLLAESIHRSNSDAMIGADPRGDVGDAYPSIVWLEDNIDIVSPNNREKELRRGH
jgi:hypothetical protein